MIFPGLSLQCQLLRLTRLRILSSPLHCLGSNGWNGEGFNILEWTISRKHKMIQSNRSERGEESRLWNRRNGRRYEVQHVIYKNEKRHKRCQKQWQWNNKKAKNENNMRWSDKVQPASQDRNWRESRKGLPPN